MQLTDKLQISDTPKHGSWPNMAESELTVFRQVCTGGRLQDRIELAVKMAILETENNHPDSCLDYRFTNTDARTKLTRYRPAYIRCDRPLRRHV